jgi:hypothetical protein
MAQRLDVVVVTAHLRGASKGVFWDSPKAQPSSILEVVSLRPLALPGTVWPQGGG